MKLSSFFCRVKTKNHSVSLAISRYVKQKFLSSAFRLFSSFSISSISSYAFHASFPVEYSKDIGGSFLLEADASVAVSTSELLSIALHTNDKLQISIRARRVRERKRPTAQRLARKLFVSRCAQKANLRMRCAIALMPVRPAGPSLDFDQV